MYRERSQQGTFFTRKNLQVMEMEQDELWERVENSSASSRQTRTVHESNDYPTTSKV